MKQYIAITISALEATQKELLMNELAAVGSTGAEETEDGVIVYFNHSDWKEEWTAIIQHYSTDFTITTIEEENWNALWESNFDPVLIDDFCYVRAHFHPERTDFEHIIHITPKMSFGTGHHATTFQVIQMMRKMEWKSKRVFDFGTGTGILAILAQLLGADKIIAIDNDPWSIENAEENATNNQIDNIHWQLSSIDEVKDTTFDIIIANINRHILLENMAAMSALLIPNGQIIMSGILEEDRSLILDSATDHGLHLLDQTQKDKWLCLRFTKKR